MTATPETLFEWSELIERTGANAGPDFMPRAKAHVLEYLKTHEKASGEELSAACVAAGIVPDNSMKAFGSVYRSLSFEGLIEVCGTVRRARGHGCSGGNLWRLAR